MFYFVAAHWKAGHKTVCVPFNDNQNTIVVKPTYNDFSGLVSMKEVVNSYRFDATGQPDGEGSRAAQGQNGRGKSKPKVSKPKEGKAMIIKAQVPMILDPQKGMVSDSKHVVENSKTGDFGTFSGILIYNRTRDFQCCIRRDGQREVYDVLDRVIRAKGSMGLKGYFTAELESEDRLKIKVKDMLAEQPW